MGAGSQHAAVSFKVVGTLRVPFRLPMRAGRHTECAYYFERPWVGVRYFAAFSRVPVMSNDCFVPSRSEVPFPLNVSPVIVSV